MRLKPGAKVFLGLVVVFLLGFGAYKLGWLTPMMKAVAPEKKATGKVDAGDFSFGKQGDAGTADNQGGQATSGKTVAGGKLNRPIKVAIVLWGGYAGGIMANGGFKPNKESVFFKDHGIEVELVQIDDFQASRDAFRAGGDKGGVDIMWSTVDAYALEYQSLAELNPQCILQYDWSRGGDAIAVGPGIKQASDLKGKKISVAEATPSRFFLLYVLSQAGLSQNDVKIVGTASAIEAAQVFKAGKVDACVSWSPDVYMAAEARKGEGAKILASTREATNLIADIFVARGDFVEQYPAETQAFIAGWLKGVDMVGEDPDTACQLMANNFDGIKLADAEGMLADVKLPTAAENRQFFELDGDTLIGYDDLFSAASNIWKKVGLLDTVARPDVSRNTTYLAKATNNWAGGLVAAAPQEEFAFKPAPAEVKKSTPIVTKRITIYFPSGVSTLDPNAEMVLEKAAELAQTFGSAYLKVSGNTDNVGSRDMNVELSRKRAQAVVDFMVKKYGFPRDKFIVVGNGPDKPVADNKTDEGKAKNRRTDFEVVAQEE
jgi:NitT/TauT family transport system substrate-binding protein